MVKLDPTVTTLSVAGALAIAISVMMNWAASGVASKVATTASGTAQAADGPAPRPMWAASATGRIEPKDGEVRIDTSTPGRIAEVLVATGDRVEAGDLLVRLDDEELFQRLTAAEAEALVRVRERDEEAAPKGPATDKRKADDLLADAERALFKARLAVDAAVRATRSGQAAADDLTKARQDLTAAKEKVATERANVDKLAAKSDTPLPTRLESSLTVARAELAQIEQAIERTRIRAPSTGNVLTVWAKVGEMAEALPDTALLLFGDLSALRVRAEVEERDVVKVKLGQRVIVRADAFPEQDFEGVVTQLAPALGPPRILSRGPRRPNDVEVLEVLATLDGNPPLLTGMRVDVFFKNDAEASASTQ